MPGPTVHQSAGATTITSAAARPTFGSNVTPGNTLVAASIGTTAGLTVFPTTGQNSWSRVAGFQQGGTGGMTVEWWTRTAVSGDLTQPPTINSNYDTDRNYVGMWEVTPAVVVDTEVMGSVVAAGGTSSSLVTGVNNALVLACLGADFSSFPTVTGGGWSADQAAPRMVSQAAATAGTSLDLVIGASSADPTTYGLISVKIGSTDATGSGSIPTIDLTAPDGEASGTDTASGPIPTIDLSAPSGAATGTSNITASGSVPTIDLSAPSGRALGGSPVVISSGVLLALASVNPDVEISSAALLVLGEPPPPPVKISNAVLLALGEVVPGMRISEGVVLCLVDAEPCVSQRCDCWIINRTDGVRMGYTSHNKDVFFHGVTCKACKSLTASATEQSADLASTGNVQVSGIIDDASISEEDLYAGLYDDAFVEIWRMNWGELYGIETSHRTAAGWVGNTEQGEQGFSLEVLGPGTRMGQQAITTVFSPVCRFVFGNLPTTEFPEGSPCGVNLALYAQPGNLVLAAADRASLLTSIVDPGPIGGITPQWNNGTIVWTSGRNAGLGPASTCETKTVDFETGQIILWIPAPYPPEFGDEFTLNPGCDHSAARAAAAIPPNQNHGEVPAVAEGGCLVYDNILNFGGFNLVPGPDAIISLPNSNY